MNRHLKGRDDGKINVSIIYIHFIYKYLLLYISAICLLMTKFFNIGKVFLKVLCNVRHHNYIFYILLKKRPSKRS